MIKHKQSEALQQESRTSRRRIVLGIAFSSLVAFGVATVASAAEQLIFSEGPATNLTPALLEQVFESQEPSRLEFSWTDTGLLQSGQELYRVEVTLEITTGTNVDFPDEGAERIANFVRDVRGHLIVDGHRSFVLRQENFGGFLARVESSPASDLLLFVMPVRLIELGGSPTHTIVFLRFKESTLEWTRGGFTDVLESMVAQSGRDFVQLAEALRQPKPNASTTEAQPLEEPSTPETPEIRIALRGPEVLTTSDLASCVGRLTEKTPLSGCEPGGTDPVLSGEFLGTVVADSATPSAARVGISLVPGSSGEAQDRIINFLAELSGYVEIKNSGGASTLDLNVEHRGNLYAKSDFNPANGDLDFFVPISLRVENSTPLLGDLRLSCNTSLEGLLCSSGEIVIYRGEISFEQLLDLGQGHEVDVGSAKIIIAPGCNDTCQNCTNFQACPACLEIGGPNLQCQDTQQNPNKTCCVRQNGTVVACRECVPPSPPCSGPLSEPVETRRITLRLAGAVQRSEVQGEYQLDRTESVDGMSYLIDEWTILERESGSEVTAIASSTTGFSRDVLKTVPTSQSSFASLVIEGPVHPVNARHIRVPLVVWRDVAVDQYSGPPTWAAVRLDIGGNRLVREVEVLAASSVFPAIDLAGLAQEGLDLAYFSEKEHRAFVYLALEARDGHLSLLDSDVILPLCCCTFQDCENWPTCQQCVP